MEEMRRGGVPESAHREAGKLLGSQVHSGKTDVGDITETARKRLIEYTAGARAFLARAEERGVATSEARALKVEAKAKANGDARATLLALGELDVAVDERVDSRGSRARDRVLHSLQSSGNSVVIAEAIAAWTEMEAFIRDSPPRPGVEGP